MRRVRLLAVAVIVCAALAAPVLIFMMRAPVLVVTDVSFSLLHGAAQLRQQRIFASLSLFRQVKPVMIADGASPDMVIIAITQAAPLPLCVLFPGM